MLFNYLLTWLRNQRRQLGYALLNVMGLALGLASVMLITLFIRYEFSYDRQHVHADRIYQAVKQDEHGGGYMGSNRFAVSPAPMAEAMMAEFPEVEAATRLKSDQALLRSGNQVFMESRWVWADSPIFDVFTIPLVRGDAGTVLRDPFSVVVSESMAKKYFGDQDPVGQVLTYDNTQSFHVTGVMRDMPENAHIKGDFLAQFETQAQLGRRLDSWGSNSYHTFFLLRAGADPAELEAKYPAFMESKMAQYSWWKKEEASRWYNQRLTDIHLRADTIFNFGSVSDIKYLYILSAIASFILLIACMNYMNLATARSVKRAREVGIRKAVGAQRGQLVAQFLAEALVMVMTALVLALVVAWLFLPVFNGLVDRAIPAAYLWHPGFLALLLAIGLGVALISGSYPALFISRYRPVTALKSSNASAQSGAGFRHVLVLIQFAVSVVLIISTVVVSRQMDYIRNKKLGFTKDQIVTIQMHNRNLSEQAEALKQELLTLPTVCRVSYSSSLPMRVSSNTTMHYEGEIDPENGGITTYTADVDADFFDLFEMEMAQGRTFSVERDAPSSSYILNETAAQRLGWTDAVGRLFGRRDDLKPVVGVVKDFHYADLHLPMAPVALTLQSKFRYGYLSIKISGEDIPGTLKAIESVWNRFSSGYPFAYRFMDDRYDAMYKSEIRLGRSFRYFSVLAIVICCLGLFGLASFSTEQRSKEIGIRKVLGGSVSGIVFMLLKQFTRWVVVANGIAWPVAWFVMGRWLRDFAYRINLGVDVFLLSAFMALAIAVLTVSYQSVKVGLANPVKSLRHE